MLKGSCAHLIVLSLCLTRVSKAITVTVRLKLLYCNFLILRFLIKMFLTTENVWIIKESQGLENHGSTLLLMQLFLPLYNVGEKDHVMNQNMYYV